jgi:hypothetical protein
LVVGQKGFSHVIKGEFFLIFKVFCMPSSSGEGEDVKCTSNLLLDKSLCPLHAKFPTERKKGLGSGAGEGLRKR